jgi:uncharacterized protein YkwD
LALALALALAAPLTVPVPGAGAAAQAHGGGVPRFRHIPPQLRHSAPHDVLKLVNAERARVRCPLVDEDKALRRAAQRHSERMARARTLSHIRPENAGPARRAASAGYRSRRVGENIARGHWSAVSVVRAWMRSPEHRAIVTTCAFRDGGVGVSSGRGGPWWTLLLATRRR